MENVLNALRIITAERIIAKNGAIITARMEMFTIQEFAMKVNVVFQNAC